MYFLKNSACFLALLSITATQTLCMLKQLTQPNSAQIVFAEENLNTEKNAQFADAIAENERCHTAIMKCVGYEDVVNIYAPQLPATQEEQELVAMFVALKKKEAAAKEVPLLFTTEQNTTTAQALECTEGKFTLILVNQTRFLKYTKDARKFFLAHELGHIAKKHVAVIPEKIFTDKQEQSKLHHAMEFAADEYAAHLLGTITYGLNYFGVQCNDACTKIIAQPDKWAFIATPGHPCRAERAFNLINFLTAGFLSKNLGAAKGLPGAEYYCPRSDTANKHQDVAQ